MATWIALDNFCVEVAGADVFIYRGDIYDSTHAAAIAAGGTTNGHFAVIPTGLTTFHRGSGPGTAGGAP